MKRWWLLGLFALPAMAQYSESCRCRADDPYDQGPVMPSGRYAGRCQNNCVSRTLRPLTPIDGETVEIANVIHDGRFYTAALPMHDVSRVLVQTIFQPGLVGFMAGHTQTRFQFATPVTLRPQAGWDDGHGDLLVRDIIISAEANGPQGEAFDIFVNGMKGTYTLVYRAIALDPLRDDVDRIGRDAFIPGRPGSRGGRIRQMDLNLNQEQRTKLLRGALAYAQRAGSFQIYHSLAKNCSTEFFFSMLDASLPPLHHLWNHLAAMHPVLNHDALRERGFYRRTVADLGREHACLVRGGAPEACLENR